jgi:hypothetical protein
MSTSLGVPFTRDLIIVVDKALGRLGPFQRQLVCPSSWHLPSSPLAEWHLSLSSCSWPYPCWASAHRHIPPLICRRTLLNSPRKDKLARTSAGQDPTRHRSARTPTVRITPSLEMPPVPTLPNLVNSLNDWCIFAPPDPGPGSVVGNTEVCIDCYFTHWNSMLMLKVSAN